MEIWIIAALASSLLWSLQNVTDQHLIRGIFTGNPVGIVIFVGIFELIISLVLIALLFPIITFPSLSETFFIIILGAFVCASFVPYFAALKIDEARVVVPLFQLIPVFTLFFEVLILQTVLSGLQTLACTLIIFASLGILYDFSQYKIKWETLFLIALFGFMYCIFTLASKHSLQTIHWLPFALILSIGNGLFALIATMIKPQSARAALNTFQTAGKKMLFLFLFLELIGLSAMIAYQKSLSEAPAASLVQTVSGGLNPLFVIILTAFLSLFLPKTLQSVKVNWILLWQIFCISLIGFGLYLIA